VASSWIRDWADESTRVRRRLSSGAVVARRDLGLSHLACFGRAEARICESGMVRAAVLNDEEVGKVVSVPSVPASMRLSGGAFARGARWPKRVACYVPRLCSCQSLMVLHSWKLRTQSLSFPPRRTVRAFAATRKAPVIFSDRSATIQVHSHPAYAE